MFCRQVSIVRETTGRHMADSGQSTVAGTDLGRSLTAEVRMLGVEVQVVRTMTVGGDPVAYSDVGDPDAAGGPSRSVDEDRTEP